MALSNLFLNERFKTKVLVLNGSSAESKIVIIEHIKLLVFKINKAKTNICIIAHMIRKLLSVNSNCFSNKIATRFSCKLF